MWIKRWSRRLLKGVLCLSFLCFALGAIGIGAIGVWAVTGLDTDLEKEAFFTVGKDRTTRLYYYDEGGMAVELEADRISGYENALWCPLEEMSPYLIDAFVAIEDKRFFEHGGIDWARTASATLDYLRKGEGHFGGSTITQQLVKNVTGDTERSVRRKMAELLRAVKLEKELDKSEILEQYLNVVNLSENCYGVRTAANAYFSKEPADLTPREAATVAAITNNPAKYNPIRHPEANRKRRDIILGEMLAQGRINEETYREAVAEQTELHVHREVLSGRINSWYADMVVNDVIRALTSQRGMSEAAASRLVYCGGLKIFTAMDPAIQEIVTAFYEDPDHFPTHQDGKKAQSALLLLDPQNGDILAVAGAVGQKESNRIQSFACDTKRPSGSVIKPLSVYAPALESGLITYGTVFDDVPISYKENGAPWPRNAPNLYRGLTTVNTAVRQSVNTVCVSILDRLGRAASYRFLTEKLGFTSLDRQNDMGAAALALGQQHTGVTLREIVGGYTALANSGVYVGTRSYYKVLDSNDELLLENAPREQRAMERADAAILTLMLRGAVQDGTGSAVTLKRVVDVAGKTGTTGKNCDKWFVGYTPELLCGVWYGYEYPEPLNDVKGNPALRIFDGVMQDVITVRPIEKRHFETPDNVVAVRYCKDSGALPCRACSLDPRGGRIEYGYFKKGTEPHHTCSCHVTVRYCDKGGVASEHCPEEGCREIALLRVSRSFPRQIKIEDAGYTYKGPVPNIERDFVSNEPYYAVSDDSKRYYGIGVDVVPFNRICPAHTKNDFWRRRADVE